MNVEIKKLISAALDIRKNSYAPYSHYAVGAAVLADDGSIFTGVNVENASYPVGICAERTALSSAVSSGKRSFKAIALAGGKEGEEPADHCLPCGMCRQFMSELCTGELIVISARSEEDYRLFKLSELLPHTFKL